MKEGRGGSNGYPSELGGIGRILAGALQHNPVLSFLGILMVIAALVTIPVAIALRNGMIFVAFLMPLIFAAWLGTKVFSAEVGRQGARVEQRPAFAGTKTPMQLAHELSDEKKEFIQDILQKVAESAARVLKVAPENTRSNIFALDSDGQLRPVTEFMFNMDYVNETKLQIPVGEGSSGHAFAAGVPNFAIVREGRVDHGINKKEDAKVHPDLQWIISIPVLDAAEKPFWILNVDGLNERREVEELKPALDEALKWVELIPLVVAQEQGAEVRP